MTLLQKINRLDHLTGVIPPLLFQIGETEFSRVPAPGKWSKKQILGHLIDSAANNHHRWVRAQFEDTPFITYDQNKWNDFSYYQEIPSSQLITFWTAYNLQLLALIKLMPQENLQRLCHTGGQPLSLEFLFIDYAAHLEHHLKQITAY